MKSRSSSKGIRRARGLESGTPVESMVRKGQDAAHPVDAVYGKLRLPKPVDVLVEEMREAVPAKKPRQSRSRASR